MTNIHDIAKLAGVSVSTVSRVLNNYKYVSEEKRLKVKQIIKELNYTPNNNAIDLIRGETKRIGVIIPYNNNQAFDQMLHGILNKSSELDFSVTVLPSKYNKKRELEYLAMLKSKQLDALIITSKANHWDKIIPFTQYGTIISCEYTEREEIGCAYVDRFASYLEVFQMLKQKGHQRIAFTTARGNESISTKQTINAYQNVIGEMYQKFHIGNCFCLEDGYKAAEILLNQKNRPTAIYANGDEVAGGIFQYCQYNKLQIPEEVAIVGQENQPIGEALGITTVNHRLSALGAQAFELAVNRTLDKIEIPYEIIQRSST
ncbi:LacI family transcriptional regulator [Virgibacillus pantothenticus]|uniref:LacI family DNA-binding transcriptional regulator n=1 Tax=Virgibacillus TaxID=84406 RepID=UPI00090A9379|nr:MULTISPECIES: LacI family DNA-binding transcriptional regulator [Virgibacillus]API91653.1 LacI family transcriptional regulator [Virgibacillus sp. 6R]MBS7427761.1 LacI family DNA-binding transcriptional regulator [Virgibacillus sp. 19R1-5]MBU8568771.1 LacI family DNA-binding transcriptional regulator [Virgibacillus pantothenticus]MBU8602810.1 LacI family DNA-binding transcriptional regulator [Virgibacillus pantothenticus]MBU8636902.1 LacI family DNA-binding transcriptional regulator [Virgib